MSAGEPLQAEKIADETPDDGKPVIAETHEDDAWMEACRTGTASLDDEAEIEAELAVDHDLQDAEPSEVIPIAGESDDASTPVDATSGEPETARMPDGPVESDPPVTEISEKPVELDEIDTADVTAEAADPGAELITDPEDLPLSTDSIDALAEDEPAEDETESRDFEKAAEAEDENLETGDESAALVDDSQSQAMFDEGTATAATDSVEPAPEDVDEAFEETALAADTIAAETATQPSENVSEDITSAEKSAAVIAPLQNKMAKAPRGNADDPIGALAAEAGDDDDPLEDFEASVGLYDAPSALAEPTEDMSVAPYIAQAERELEKSRSRGSHDIFDRIAMAAESQFDNARGSAMRRVDELVDDRRVGTKRWTPSKTMKQRMAKLEAARAAAESGDTFEARKKRREDAPTVPVQETEAATDSAAPASATAATIAVGTAATAKAAAAVAEKPQEPVTASEPAAAEAPEKTAQREWDDNERVSISRRDRQAEARDGDASVEDEDLSGIEDEAEEDVDGLRIVPGARGRRRDRARRSRLDEDFEKIFDEEDKPSIRGLRRKLRSGAAGRMDGTEKTAVAEEDESSAIRKAEARRALMQQTEASAIEEPRGLFARLFRKKPREDAPQSGGFLSGLMSRSKTEDTGAEVAIETVEDEPSDGAIMTVIDPAVAELEEGGHDAIETASDAAPAGLFSRFRSARKAKTEAVDEDELVAAFEADSAPLENPLDIAREEDGADEAWEQTLQSEKKRSPLLSSIMGVGVIGALFGFGFFAYHYFTSL